MIRPIFPALPFSWSQKAAGRKKRRRKAGAGEILAFHPKKTWASQAVKVLQVHQPELCGFGAQVEGPELQGPRQRQIFKTQVGGPDLGILALSNLQT